MPPVIRSFNLASGSKMQSLEVTSRTTVRANVLMKMDVPVTGETAKASMGSGGPGLDASLLNETSKKNSNQKT